MCSKLIANIETLTDANKCLTETNQKLAETNESQQDNINDLITELVLSIGGVSDQGRVQ